MRTGSADYLGYAPFAEHSKDARLVVVVEELPADAYPVLQCSGVTLVYPIEGRVAVEMFRIVDGVAREGILQKLADQSSL
jgi:hypothetical protein